MPFQNTRQGYIVGDSARESMARPKQTIEMLLFDPTAQRHAYDRIKVRGTGFGATQAPGIGTAAIALTIGARRARWMTSA